MKLDKNTIRKSGKPERRVISFVPKICFLSRLFQVGFLQKRLLLCLLILVTCIVSKAQFPEYYVYSIKGTATIKQTNGKAVNVKQHGLLYKQDILVLKTGTELTLVDIKSNFIVLSRAGNYKVTDLKTDSNSKRDGLSKKYLKLIWNELLAPGKDYTVFKKESLTELSGSPSRGNKKCDNLIFPVDSMKTSEDTNYFKWRQTNDSGVYNFIIIDPEGKKLELPVRDTQYTVRMSEAFGQQTGKYCWLVKGKESFVQTSKSSTCESEAPVCFELITKEKEAQIVDSLGRKSLPRDLIRQLEIVTELEKVSLIYRAKKMYSNLVKSNPGDTALLKGFVFFLLKYGFDKEALSVWNDVRNN